LAAEAQKDPSLAAELFTKAAFVMKKVDSDFATLIVRGESCFTELQRVKIINVARFEEHMANNHKKKNNFEASIDGINVLPSYSLWPT